ncbi:MAG TPA: circadian clock protein KaiC [Candidatus Obscuribacterales bacterium]
MTEPVERLKTGIDGLDAILYGGLTRRRSTLVAGTSGSAKTVLAVQFLAEGIVKFDQPGVFVTFEEAPDDIRTNMSSFGWDIAQWEKENKWIFVDAAPRGSEQPILAGEFDFGGLIARVEHAARKVKAKRASIDTLAAIFLQFKDVDIVRGELLRLTERLKELDVTSLITVERLEEYGDVSRFGVEEFVTDNVLILRNAMDQEKRRRTVEVLKLRGADHIKGECPFTVNKKYGIALIPLSSIELKQRSSNVRVTSGNETLDKMCSGGFFRDSIILVSGATGTGKTLLSSEFLYGGARQNERCLLFAFEESREQLFRNAQGWGMDFEKLEEKGLLKVICLYPEVRGLEDHLIDIREAIEAFQPQRVAVDSLSALERAAHPRGFREFVIAVTSYIKTKEITGLFTATTPSLVGGASITETHISTITDTIILLRYVEMLGHVKRGITVLKMRGSMHQKEIRELEISDRGARIKGPFRKVVGVLSGNPQFLELEQESA